MKKKSIFASLLILIIVSLMGCTGIKEVAVDTPTASFNQQQDLSMYIVQDEKVEEKKVVPLDPNLEYLNTAEFKALMNTTKATSGTRTTYEQYPSEWKFVLVDARPQKVYNEGHINGAINIPDSEFDKYKNLLPENKDSLIVFYCGGLDCPLSKNSALKAKELGYTNIKVYQEGTPAWKAAGNYLVVGTEYVKDIIMETYVSREDTKPYVLIDARPYKMYFDEHIPNSIPMDDTLFSQKYATIIPTDKSSDIIIYCGGFSCGKSHTVAKELVARGYTNVKVYAGGLPTWKAAGLPSFGMKSTGGSFNVAEGKVDRGLTPDQFTEKIKATNVVVLDVRTAEERSNGAIPGSIHIPDSEIHANPQAIASKLPKDKNTTILIHCASGVRAGGVVNKVADLGYPNTFYLNNAIHISEDGTFGF